MRRLLGCVPALLLIIGTPCWSQTTSRDDLQSVFQRLLENPSDISLNFRYAELAIEQNRLRNALAAYERVLATDPNNEDAKAGIRQINQMLKPQFTALTLSLGGQYETNPKLASGGPQKSHDSSVLPRAEVIDERLVGNLRLRSEGELFSNFYGRFTDLNYGKASVNTGPIFGVGSWEVRPALGAAYAWLDGDTFYNEATAQLSFAPTTPGSVLRRINTRFSYDWIDRDVAQRDAFLIEVAPQLIWLNRITEQDTILLSPFYRFNGVNGDGPSGVVGGEPFPLQSHQFGGRLDYYIPVLQDLAIDFNVTSYYQPYNQAVTNGTSDRHDVYFAPGIQLILKEALFKRHDLVLGYLYEDNHSNDSTHSFTNHVVSLRSVWKF